MRLEELTNKAIDYIVVHMDTDRLTKWEQGFFESVSDQWSQRRRLSDEQKLKLGEIWDRQP